MEIGFNFVLFALPTEPRAEHPRQPSRTLLFPRLLLPLRRLGIFSAPPFVANSRRPFGLGSISDNPARGRRISGLNTF
eukprot:COSAG04_NODE_618_length_11896_cov_81.925659_6_plen_78_part_00